MNIGDFLVEVAKRTNGWVILLVFALYIGNDVWRKVSETRKRRESMKAVQDEKLFYQTTITELLKELRTIMRSQLKKLDALLQRDVPGSGGKTAKG